MFKHGNSLDVSDDIAQQAPLNEHTTTKWHMPGETDIAIAREVYLNQARQSTGVAVRVDVLNHMT